MILYKMKNRFIEGDFSFCFPERALIGAEKGNRADLLPSGGTLFKGSEF